MGGPRTFNIELQILSKIFTGGPERESEVIRDTGLIGSLRWWYEALIRALGGTACDPSESECEGIRHCDACELFGCSGWSRKFIFRSCEESDETLKIQITELRRVEDVELALLNRTLRIIENYGALGAKLAHRDYGIINIKENDLDDFRLEKLMLQSYLKKQGSRTDNPNLKRFIFIKNPDFRFVKKLKNDCSFLKGSKNKGKRYFHKNSPGNRLFAYANKDEYHQLRKCAGKKAKTWEEVKKQIFGKNF